MSENVNMDAMAAATEIAEHVAELHDFAKELADMYKKGSSASQGVVSLVYDHLKAIDYEFCVFIMLNGDAKLPGSFFTRGARSIAQVFDDVSDERIKWVADCMAESLCDTYARDVNWKK